LVMSMLAILVAQSRLSSHRMQLGILGGAGADGLKVLVVAMPLGSTLKATVEQPSHDLLIVRNVTITVQPEDMGLPGGVAIRNGERGVHGFYSMGFRGLSSHRLK
jgi:hypothetical protein